MQMWGDFCFGATGVRDGRDDIPFLYSHAGLYAENRFGVGIDRQIVSAFAFRASVFDNHGLTEVVGEYGFHRAVGYHRDSGAVIESSHPAGVAVTDLMPRSVSFRPGDEVLFFTVREAEKGRYWIAETPKDRHLAAFVAVLAHASASRSATVFHVVTIVHYKHWTGPVYFNLIRPFHHLVVSRMARAGTAASDCRASG
jgi:hypothetical protein